jgi:hypothetical protein
MRRRRAAAGQAALFATKRVNERPAPLELQMQAAGIPAWEPEFAFHPVRKWAFDYAWPPWKVALEQEGGGFGRLIVITSGYERRKGKSIPITAGTRVRVGGRHNTGEGMQEDCIKYNAAAVLGWLVIRVTTTMVRDGLALEELQRAFKARGLE